MYIFSIHTYLWLWSFRIANFWHCQQKFFCNLPCLLWSVIQPHYHFFVNYGPKMAQLGIDYRWQEKNSRKKSVISAYVVDYRLKRSGLYIMFAADLPTFRNPHETKRMYLSKNNLQNHFSYLLRFFLIKRNELNNRESQSRQLKLSKVLDILTRTVKEILWMEF